MCNPIRLHTRDQRQCQVGPSLCPWKSSLQAIRHSNVLMWERNLPLLWLQKYSHICHWWRNILLYPLQVILLLQVQKLNRKQKSVFPQCCHMQAFFFSDYLTKANVFMSVKKLKTNKTKQKNLLQFIFWIRKNTFQGKIKVKKNPPTCCELCSSPHHHPLAKYKRLISSYLSSSK